MRGRLQSQRVANILYRRRAAPAPGASGVLSTMQSRLDFSQDPVARRSALIAIIGFATVVGRLHEMVGPLRLIRPIFVVVALMVVATLSARRRMSISQPLFADRSLLILYAYWGWMIATVPTSIDRGNSLRFALDIAIVFIFATMLAAQPPTWPQLRQVTRGFLFSTSLFAVLLLVRSSPVMDVDGLRYSITASLDPNDCAGFLAIGAPIALAECIRKGGRGWRILSLAMFVVICAGLIRTGSRGGFIALAAGIVVVFLSGRGLKVVAGGLFLLLLGLGGRVAAPSLLPARLASIGNLENDSNFTVYGGRIQIWKRGVRYFLQDPVMGVGVDNFGAREGIQMLEDGQPGHWSAPHSAYVQSFVELGLPGGLLFCAAVIVSLVKTAPVYRKLSPISGMSHPEYMAAVVAFSISGIFLSHAYSWGFFALVALCSLVHKTLVRS